MNIYTTKIEGNWKPGKGNKHHANQVGMWGLSFLESSKNRITLQDHRVNLQLCYLEKHYSLDKESPIYTVDKCSTVAVIFWTTSVSGAFWGSALEQKKASDVPALIPPFKKKGTMFTFKKKNRKKSINKNYIKLRCAASKPRSSCLFIYQFPVVSNSSSL